MQKCKWENRRDASVSRDHGNISSRCVCMYVMCLCFCIVVGCDGGVGGGWES